MQVQKVNYQRSNIVKSNSDNKVAFGAAKVLIQEANIIKEGVQRNKASENALNKLFNVVLAKMPKYLEALQKAPEDSAIIPRVGYGPEYFIIDLKQNGVTKYSCGTNPVMDIVEEKSINRLGTNLATELNKLG